MYLFFDTETTGLPKNRDLPFFIVDNWPRLVQIAWLIFDENKNLIKEKNYIIKPEGFDIPFNVTQIHKIDTEYAFKNGTDLEIVLSEFIADMKNVYKVIAHNISFDENVVSAEIHRKGIENIFERKYKYCTMKEGVNICRLLNGKGFKFPSLQELHFNLFNCFFENGHNALEDVKACAKCYWEIEKIKNTK